ncbi:MAG: chitobiase/beta-hexosaminidase C-terminal domain-containing protein [Prevotella sp.]|nr:chitobiase/beta-hexosaminidase C-terminal domain-containing protein [Prevotella sp.]
MNKKNIFKWLFVYVLLLVAGVTSAVAQSLTIADFQIKAGETKTVTIKLDKGSLADVYSVQADIAFSDGLSLDGDPELISGVLSGGTLAFNTFTSGVTRISALSMSGKTFTAEEIINLPVKAAENFERGTITLSNIEFAITNTGQTFKPENSTTAVTKEEEQQGEEVEAQWVAKDKGYSNGDEVTESVIDNNVSVTFNKGTGSNAPKYYTTGEAVRVYGGGNFTIASTTATIVKIELTFGTGDGNNEITTDVASYENGTWTGEAQSVKFTVGGTSGNRRIAGITVTYKGGSDVPPTPITVAAPTFSVPEGTYTEAQTVTLACETEGAAIYYTLDGTDPTAESTLYEAPITISTTTTVKAIAIKDDVLSAVATATYTFPVVAENIAAFKALDVNAEAVLTLTDAIVSHANGDNVFVEDATGGICFYKSGAGLVKGNKLSGTIYGKYAEYKSLPELAVVTGKTSLDNVVIANEVATVTPAVLSITEASAAAYAARMVKIEDVTVTVDGNKTYITDAAGAQLQIYITYGSTAELPAADTKLKSITGLLIPFNTSFEIVPLTQDDIVVDNGEEETLKEVTIDHERTVGLGYGVTTATVDLTEAAEFLGVDAITTDMLYVENPDGTLISNYGAYDGWFDGDGVATTWGSTTKVCVKFFEAIPDGVFSICDMNGADVVGETYTVRWQLVSGEKAVRYTINVTFVAAEQPEPEVIQTINVPVTMKPATAYEAISATFDAAAVAEALGLESLATAKAYIVNVTDGSFVLNGTDGWRDANGDAAAWGSGAGMVCVKINNPASGVIDYLGAIDETYAEGSTYTAKWGFVNEATNKAVVLNINITFTSATGIDAINAALSAGKVYNLSGQQVQKAQKGIYIIGGKKMVVK